jgi:hypothetical protein
MNTFSLFEHAHDESDSIASWESDIISLESMSSMSTSPTHSPTTSKNTFDSSMYDCLGRIIVIKVTSHQLHPDFTINSTTKGPIPNMFISSANQIADNAATQAQMLYENQHENLIDTCFYPPFSPRWNFSFEGYLINKGATNIFYDKIDQELCLRMQHRCKQGVLLRMSSFNSLKSEQIGEESILMNIMKLTAPCSTRCIYRYPPLANQIWTQWRKTQQNTPYYGNIPKTLPKDWRKNEDICKDIIKACPFCEQRTSNSIKIGNLEHLHNYCNSKHLQKVRGHCNQKIEEALHSLYDFAAKREFNCTMDEARCNTTLQENLITAARESELQERPILKADHILHEKRTNTIAIRSKHDVQLMVLLKKLDPSKLDEFDKYPLMAQLGFIHAIPEEEFNMATVTIIDITFLGFFPKKILQALQNYEKEIQRFNDENNVTFKTLIDNLVTAIVYRPITIQKVIHIMLAQQKDILANITDENESQTNDSISNTELGTLQASDTSEEIFTNIPNGESNCRCYASVCRLLQAKGIICHSMICTNG